MTPVEKVCWFEGDGGRAHVVYLRFLDKRPHRSLCGVYLYGDRRPVVIPRTTRQCPKCTERASARASERLLEPYEPRLQLASQDEIDREVTLVALAGGVTAR